MIDVAKILSATVYPVTGCTEPAAVALASSLAVHVAAGLYPAVDGTKEEKVKERKGERIASKGRFKLELLHLRTSRSIFKNAMAVGIPPDGKGVGVRMAGAMGAFLSPDEGLNLFKNSNTHILKSAENLIRSGRFILEVVEKEEEIFIEALAVGTAARQRHVGEAVISGAHDNVVLLRRNGEVLKKSDDKGQNKNELSSRVFSTLNQVPLCEIIEACKNLKGKIIDEMIKGVEMNRRAAMKGISMKLGLGVGATIKEMIQRGLISNDILSKIKMETAGAADARMSGYEIEIMASGGSGNQGIMAVIPVAVVAENMNVSRERLGRAVALSHLITAQMTGVVGILSALCGCVVKAGMGASAGIAWLLSDSGEVGVVESAIANMAGNIIGEICDGAKVGCALKLATASGAAAECAFLALKGVRIPWTNGIVGVDSIETMKNIEKFQLSTKETNRAIIEIINDKKPFELAGKT